MTLYTDITQISEIASSLSNKNRLYILEKVIEINGGTLIEIHEKTCGETGLSHRETTHTYLEELVKVSLLSKNTNTHDEVIYSSECERVCFDLEPK